MATKTVDIAVAQASLSDLVLLANSGVEVVLTRDSSPVACLVPVPLPSLTPARKAGLHAGDIRVSDDFDEPLPDEFWTGKK
jgi:antitoxin (DNA-binding transcriptional repressor) of toxin-antitoxin stability system